MGLVYLAIRQSIMQSHKAVTAYFSSNTLLPFRGIHAAMLLYKSC